MPKSKRIYDFETHDDPCPICGCNTNGDGIYVVDNQSNNQRLTHITCILENISYSNEHNMMGLVADK